MLKKKIMQTGRSKVFVFFIVVSVVVNCFCGFQVTCADTLNTTYYVSSSTGDDSNNGTSELTPWKTLSKVSTVTFQPGDTIALKGGDVWTGEFVELHGTGTATSPITLTSYGTGRPKLAYQGSAVKGNNLNGWTIKGLKIEVLSDVTFTTWKENPPAIKIIYNGEGLYRDITIEDNVIYCESFDRGSRGILIEGQYSYNRHKELVQNITITKNEIYNIGFTAIQTAAWNAYEGKHILTSSMFYNVKINNNIVHDTFAGGIVLGNANHSEIKWNKVYNVGHYERGDILGGSAGIMPIMCSHIDIRFNDVYEVEDYNGGNDSAAIDLDWLCEYTNVMNNFVHDSDGGGVQTMSVINSKISSNKMKQKTDLTNVGDGLVPLTDYSEYRDTLSGLNHVEVSDNLIFVDTVTKSAISTKMLSGGKWEGNSFIDNNIVLSAGASGVRAYNVGLNAGVDTINNNRIYSYYIPGEPGQPDKLFFSAQKGGSIYSDFGNWKSATGYDSSSNLSEFETTSPSSITGLTAGWSSSDNWITLSWNAATDSGSDIWHYNIYRSSSPSFVPDYTNMVGEAKSTIFIDKEALKDNSTYYYKVEAEDRNGNVSQTIADASATSGTLAAQPLRKFQLSEDFSTIWQGPMWYYQYLNSGVYENLSYDYEGNAWRYGTSNLYVGRGYQHPEYNMDSVLKWVAPYSGNITITSKNNISLWSGIGDGVNVKVMKNDTKIWPSNSDWQLVTYQNPVSFPSTSISVNQGDAIYFVVNNNNNITADGTSWDPIITYTSWTLPEPLPGPTEPEPLPDPLYDEKVFGDYNSGDILGQDSWSNYTIMADIKPTSFVDSGGCAGIEFMRKDGSNKYVFWLCADNTIKIMKFVNGNGTTIAPSSEGRNKLFPVSVGTSYKVKIDVYRDTYSGAQIIEVWINGLLELRASDSNLLYETGKISPSVWKATSEFKNLKIDTAINTWGEPQDILLNSTFESGTVTEWTATSGTWSIVTDMTRKYKQAGSTDAYTYAGNNTWSNYVVQSKVKIESAGTGGATDIAFRYTDNNNKYYVSLNAAGTIAIRKTIGGTDTLLASKAYLISTGTEYTVKAIVNGSYIDFYIDGKKELSVSDGSLAAGKVALHTNNATVMFDDVVVQKIPTVQTIYFSDNFEDGDASGWNVLTGNWYVGNSVTKQYIQKGTSPAISEYVNNSWTNYVMQAKVKIPAVIPDSVTNEKPKGDPNTNGYACLYFRYTNSNNTYYVSLHPSYGIELKKVVNGIYYPLQVNANYYIGKGIEYRVKIIANGSNLDVYINGRKELSAIDSSFSSGKIGLWTINTCVYFDDIEIKSIN